MQLANERARYGARHSGSRKSVGVGIGQRHYFAQLALLRSITLGRWMNGRHISRRNRAHHRSGRQNRDGAVCWTRDMLVVAAWRSGVQRRLPEQPRFAFVQDEDPIWQRGNLFMIERLRSRRFEAILMELRVHLVGGG